MEAGKKHSNDANEVMYKRADNLLQKMFISGLVDEKEKAEIHVLNVETFSPELSEIYL